MAQVLQALMNDVPVGVMRLINPDGSEVHEMYLSVPLWPRPRRERPRTERRLVQVRPIRNPLSLRFSTAKLMVRLAQHGWLEAN